MSKRVRVFVPAFAAMVAMSFMSIVVAAPATALSPPYPTVTHVHTVPASLLTGQSVVFNAAVITPNTRSVATGSVTFTITGSDASTVNCDGGSNTFALTVGTPLVGGTASCSVAGGIPAAASPYTVSVAYSGDSLHLTSTATLSQTVLLGVTKTTASSSTNPSVTGQPVTFTAVVSPTGLAVGAPTGTVTFAIKSNVNGSIVDCDGGDAVTVVSQMAQCTLSGGLLAQGSGYHVVAAYSGDGNFKPSVIAFTQVVLKDVTTIVVSPSANPVMTGQPVSFTAVLTPDPLGGGTITGTVTFTIVDTLGVVHHCDAGNTVAVSGNQVTCTFAAGLASHGINYTVSAVLTDPNFISPSGSVTVAVNQAATNLSFTVSPALVRAGVTFTITATVTPVAPGVGTPTGVVDFSICQLLTTGICVGGPTLMPATAGGVAKWVVAGGQLPGATFIAVTYLGDSNFTLSSNSRTIGIPLVSTTVNVSSSRNPSVTGEQVRLTAAVLSSGGSSSLIGPPTGDVLFTITGASGDSITCQGGSNDFGLNSSSLTQAIAICVVPAGTLTSADSPYTVRALIRVTGPTTSAASHCPCNRA